MLAMPLAAALALNACTAAAAAAQQQQQQQQRF
jgi:hypothetical protein